MTWTLALNLARRKSAVLTCYPKVVVYSIGDQAHQAECSDHNPDNRGVVHAIDIMTEAGTTPAVQTLRWLLSDTTDLQYVIHDHKIYKRSNGFRAAAYSGSDPHTNHIHVSGKHGSVGKNSATCTGYDTGAENYSPKGTPCKPYKPPPVKPPQEDEVTQADKDEIVNRVIHAVFSEANFNPDSKGQYTKSLRGKLDEIEKKIDGLPKA